MGRGFGTQTVAERVCSKGDAIFRTSAGSETELLEEHQKLLPNANKALMGATDRKTETGKSLSRLVDNVSNRLDKMTVCSSRADVKWSLKKVSDTDYFGKHLHRNCTRYLTRRSETRFVASHGECVLPLGFLWVLYLKTVRHVGDYNAGGLYS